MVLARDLFTALKDGNPVQIPQYDKSAYSGLGDRVPPSRWDQVNGPGQPKIQVVVFEGWCVGFRALPAEEIERMREASKVSASATLWKHRLEDLLFVNEKLAGYDLMTDMFDAFIHIDAEEIMYAYEWRLEQEAALRREKGRGMTDEQVVRFVDGYYPAYELHTDALRRGVFKGEDSVGRQLRLVVGRDRRVKEAIQI
jgi:D-glycerate 3-kinase